MDAASLRVAALRVEDRCHEFQVEGHSQTCFEVCVEAYFRAKQPSFFINRCPFLTAFRRVRSYYLRSMAGVPLPASEPSPI